MTDIRVLAGDCLTALIAARLELDSATFERVTELEPIPAPVLTLVPDLAPDPTHLEDMTMALENADAGAPRNPAGRRRDDFGDFPRDAYKRPKIIRAVLNPDTDTWTVPRDPDGNLIKEMLSFTRASTLGGAIEFQGGLSRWKTAVAIWGVVRSRTLAKRVRAIAGYSKRDDKDELYEIIDKAEAFAESDSKANHGTALHSIFRRIAEGATVAELVADGSLDEDDVYAAEAFAAAISGWTVMWAERRVVCDEAQAAGKYDLIVSPKRPMPVTDKAGKIVAVILPGDLVTVDNKTSGTADYFGEKFAVQLWIYANGRDYDQETGERTEVGVRKDWALILHIPSEAGEGTVATWHWVDLSIGEHLMGVARSVLEGRKLGKRAIVKADLETEIPEGMLAAEYASRGGPIDAELDHQAETAIHPPVDLAPESCCDQWHPAGTTCPDPYLAPAEAQFTARMGTDAGREQDEAERRIEAEQVPAIHARELVREELAHLAGKTVGEAMDAEQLPGTASHFSPLVAEAGRSGFIDPAARVAATDETLAQRLQGAAKANAAVPDAERARAYIISKIGKATTPEDLDKLRAYSRAKGFWPKGDVELNGLAAARAAELRAMAS